MSGSAPRARSPSFQKRREASDPPAAARNASEARDVCARPPDRTGSLARGSSHARRCARSLDLYRSRPSKSGIITGTTTRSLVEPPPRRAPLMRQRANHAWAAYIAERWPSACNATAASDASLQFLLSRSPPHLRQATAYIDAAQQKYIGTFASYGNGARHKKAIHALDMQARLIAVELNAAACLCNMPSEPCI
eukprot:747081-Pleurochrysis_carterae.AAC.1